MGLCASSSPSPQVSVTPIVPGDRARPHVDAPPSPSAVVSSPPRPVSSSQTTPLPSLLPPGSVNRRDVFKHTNDDGDIEGLPDAGSTGSLFFQAKFVRRQRSKRGAEAEEKEAIETAKANVSGDHSRKLRARRNSYHAGAEEKLLLAHRKAIMSALRASAITADITDDTDLLDAIIAEMIRIDVPAGTALWNQGETAHMIYISVSGVLCELDCAAWKNSTASPVDFGETPVVNRHEAGSTVGLDSLFLKGTRQHTLVVSETARLWAIDRVTYQATLIKRKTPNVPPELAFLARVPIFRALKYEQLQMLAENMRTEYFTTDEVIMRQGSRGTKLYLLEQGTAKATDGVTGTDLSQMQEGAYFGEGSLLTKKPVSANVIATSTVTCRTLEARLFNTELSVIHDLMMKRFQVILIHQIKLFRENFTREDIEEMAHLMTTAKYKSGDVILTEQTVSQEFFIIQEGEVRETTTAAPPSDAMSGRDGDDDVEGDRDGDEDDSQNGDHEEMVVLVGGDYFGHESFLLENPANRSYVAVGNVECSTLNIEVASAVLGPVKDILKRHLEAREQFWDPEVCCVCG